MEELCELRRYIEMGDTASALALLDEMDEMSKDDKIQKNDVGHVFRGEAKIHRVQDGAQQGDGLVCLQMVVSIPRAGADAVARAHPKRRQAPGQARHPLREVSIRIAEKRTARHTGGERLLGKEPTAALEELGERQRILHHESLHSVSSIGMRVEIIVSRPRAIKHAVNSTVAAVEVKIVLRLCSCTLPACP